MMIVSEELGYVLETIRFKTSIYRDKKKRNLSFNDDDYYSNILNEYITDLQQENSRLKDKFKDLEEWLEAMASMYENEYKDVNASEHYKCMLHKLKEN